ncbi:MAG: hypothetical protein ACR2PL_27395, partial [Dehalococcoidia bacterium]
MSKRLALVIGLACLLLSLGVLPRRASASAKVGSSAVHAALPAPSPTTSPTPSPLAFSLAGTHNASIPATLSSEEQQYQALLQQDSQQFPILAYQPLGNILDVLFDPGGRARILEGIQAVVREQDYCLNFDVPDPDQGEALCAAGEAADSAIAQMGLNLIVQQILDTAFGGVDVGLAGEVGLAAVESFVQDSTGGSLPKDEMEALSAQLLGAMYGHFGLQYIAGQLGSYTTDALLSLLSQENTTQAHLSQSLNTPFGNPVNVKVSYEYNPYTHYTTTLIATDRAAG